MCLQLHSSEPNPAHPSTNPLNLAQPKIWLGSYYVESNRWVFFQMKWNSSDNSYPKLKWETTYPVRTPPKIWRKLHQFDMLNSNMMKEVSLEKYCLLISILRCSITKSLDHPQEIKSIEQKLRPALKTMKSKKDKELVLHSMLNSEHNLLPILAGQHQLYPNHSG